MLLIILYCGDLFMWLVYCVIKNSYRLVGSVGVTLLEFELYYVGIVTGWDSHLSLQQ